MYEPYIAYLSELNRTTKYRKLPDLYKKNLMNYVDFSTNDYLGLSKNPKILEKIQKDLHKYGTGSTGSRLLSGNSDINIKLERMIAKDKNMESALTFNSGFQTNLSCLSAILQETVLNTRPIVFFDKLNHSSLYQAVFLSNAQLLRYKHNDTNHLEELLYANKEKKSPKFIVTETVFGMDGDVAPLNEIVNLAKLYGAFLYLDEAHATGVFGKNGYGLSTLFDLKNIPCIVMGTFSKALGCSGGYIASSKIMCDYLINKAPGFIYATAPSPIVTYAVLNAWKMIKLLSKERIKLSILGKNLRNMLSNEGFNIANSTTHIIPIITQKNVMDLKDQLLKNKIITSAIRPPTVPENSARIRIALNCNHTDDDIYHLVKILKKTKI